MAIRRALGWTLVGSLCVAALVAIVALVGDSWDETDWRLIGTSLSFAVYSALAGAGAAVRVKEHPAAQPLGLATTGAAAVAYVLLLVLVWADDAGDAVARAFGITTLAALAGSHASLVLRATRADDTPAVVLLVVASIALGALDALVGTLAITGALDVDEDDPGTRLMAVTVVLLLLTTALPPIMRRLGAAQPAPAAWPAPRGGSLERLAGEVVEATRRIERLDDPDAIRRECRRLRETARNLGGH
jgi:hypothetical protein